MSRRPGSLRPLLAGIAAALLIPLVAAVPPTSSQQEEGHLGYYRYPTLHDDTLIFSAEGDLWRVDVGGGLARRLTTHAEEEYGASVSPDGRTVAFAASYEGPTEVYTMPIGGGLPERRTWSVQLSQVIGWTPDGDLIYTTDAFSTLPNWQLATIDLEQGTSDLIPLAQASDGSFAPDGTLFFTRLRFQGSHTRRYEGGTAQQLWRFDGEGQEARPLTVDYPGTSKTPMWWEGRVYFASDRDGAMNLWSMDPEGDDLRQHTNHSTWEVKAPSLQAGRIVYQVGPDLHLYDIAADTDRMIPIRLASDLDQMRERWIEDPIDWVTGVHLAPDGQRVALVARGEVFVMPVKRRQGRRVQVTRSPDVRYRSARFMPGGDELVALSDETGEVELWSLPANGIGERRQLTSGGDVLRWDAVPSPDGSRIAHADKNNRLWVYDTETGTDELIEENGQGGIGGLMWSPDSRWLAYTAGADNSMTRIWVLDTVSGDRTPVTTDRFNSNGPAWSPDGRFLYFLSDRNLNTFVFSPWGSYQPEPFIDRPTQIFVAMLHEGDRSPFAPDDELTGNADDSSSGDGDDDNGDSVAVEIDLEGLAARIDRVPVAPGNYFGLEANEDALFFGDRDLSPRRSGHLKAVAVGNDDPKVETLVEGIGYFELSGDGKSVLVRKGNNLHVFPAKPRSPNLADSRVDLSDWRFALDPREEWRQMFVEAWRLERDYFYDRDMHGVDWQAMVERFLPTVNRVTTRAELADLIAVMVAELSALHTFVRPGDTRDDELNVTPASLGARLARDDDAGGYRVEHIYQGDPDLPDSLSPLARPGVDVEPGEVILQIDGIDVLSVDNPAALLRSKVGEQVRLQVAGDGRPDGGEPVIVRPISQRQESGLRYDEWEYTRRLHVEEAGDGRLGYLHLRAMGRSNYEEWARNFYPIFNREGLIIDVRHNRGGNIDSWILEKLMRKAWFYWAPRVGDPYWNMQYAFRGHMITLINERTASDGEAFAEGFRRLGLGPLLGTRTWGGEIWLTSSNVLVDRGIATAAEFGVYGPAGDWLIEGWGVEPDIQIDNLPHATFGGADTQLDAAIEYLLRKLEKEPITVPVIPDGPDKSHETNRGSGQQ